MTVFRVKPDDKPYVVKKIKDPEVAKLSKEWVDTFAKFEQKLNEIQVFGDVFISASRKVYTAADKKLKDKGLSKEDREELLKLRKKSYDLTMTLKKVSIF